MSNVRIIYSDEVESEAVEAADIKQGTIFSGRISKEANRCLYIKGDTCIVNLGSGMEWEINSKVNEETFFQIYDFIPMDATIRVKEMRGGD